jgi:hypothetical protein
MNSLQRSLLGLLLVLVFIGNCRFEENFHEGLLEAFGMIDEQICIVVPDNK